MTELMAPWRPMSEAPQDGSILIVLFSDMSGTAAIFWGEAVKEPHEEGWFEFTKDIGDFDFTDDGDLEWYGWVLCPPIPENRQYKEAAE